MRCTKGNSIYGATQAWRVDPRALILDEKPLMSNLNDRVSAQITTNHLSAKPLVPDHIRCEYAKALAHIPHVQMTVRKTASSTSLPATGSFG